MLNKFKKIFFVMIVFMTGLSFVMASEDSNKEKNLVNIYLFYSDTCPHCAKEEELLDEIMDKYDNVRLYKYEIGDEDNSKLLDEVASLYDTTVSGVPFTVIGDKIYKGFSYENSKVKFMGTVDYYSNYGYVDRVGKYIGGIELPSYQINDDDVEITDYIDDYANYRIEVPLLGVVETKNLTLPVISILIGLVDGFNPCAMWVLLFLISMLIGMKDKKKMIILGTTFLLSSALVYLLFMLAWLNVATLLLKVNFVRILIGIIALVGAIFNLVGYFRHRKDNGCDVIDDKKRNRIFERIKKFTHEKDFFLAILGVILLAVSVNIVELACSAGLPVMFTQILSMNNLTITQEVLYIALYMLFFLIDDLVVFFIAVRTMQVTGVSTKYGKISKLVGGILLLLIGILLIFKPEWLMFNF
ncbi:MAG: hypothetical protein ACI4WU_04235 [Bacilli bacterium]